MALIAEMMLPLAVFLAVYFWRDNRRLKRELKEREEDGLTDVLVFSRKFRDNGDMKDVRKALAPMIGYKVMKTIEPEWDAEHYSWGIQFSYKAQEKDPKKRF